MNLTSMMNKFINELSDKLGRLIKNEYAESVRDSIYVDIEISTEWICNDKYSLNIKVFVECEFENGVDSKFETMLPESLEDAEIDTIAVFLLGYWFGHC